ncbi:MAG: hypothetical protein IKV13_05790 [Akkermansia sp.]|nr:hypothetical protein [Akkermansia sp.]
MKLHLPKNLLVAVFCCITATAYGVTFDSSSIVTPEEGGKSYLNVGMENDIDNWSGNLVVGDTDTTQGDVDYVGAFTESWGWVTPNGGNSNTTITSGLKVNGSLTVQESGKIVLGGQYNGGSSYLGLEATAGITVAGGSLTATKIITTDLTITKGTVSTNTSNCTSGNSYAGGAKQSYIKNSLTINEGTAAFGYTANVQGIGGGSHRMTAFGSSNNFKVNQTGGKLIVYGDMDLKSGSTFTQSGGTMVLRDTIYMGGSGTTTFNQSGDDSKLVLGRLESTGNIFSKPQCDYAINQSGKGLVHLAYGSNLYKAGTIALNQTGAGTIQIGGEHNTTITGALPSRGYALAGSFEDINTTYSIQQSGGGNILVKKGADITVSSASLTAGTLQVEDGASVIANTLNAGTSSVARTATPAITATNVSLADGSISSADAKVTITGTLAADKITVNNGGTLENSVNSVISVGNRLVLESGSKLVNNGVITASSAYALMTADEQAAAVLSETDGPIILKEGSDVLNAGIIDADVVVQGGTLTLGEGGITQNITMESGNILVTGNEVQTGAMTLTGGTITFKNGASVALNDGITYDLSGAEIVVMVDDVNNIEGSTVTLFSGNGNGSVTGLESATFTFQDMADPTNTVGGKITDLSNGSIKVEATVAIPEPTTATLSLLALAGLCARRRRK